MAFDVSKAVDEARVLDLDTDAPARRLPDVAASTAAASAAVAGLTGFSAAQERRTIAGMLASARAPMGLDSPFPRAPAGVPAPDTLRAFRPGGVASREIFTVGHSPLRETVAKFGSLAVTESQASAALSASTVRGIAGSLRGFDPLGEQARIWQSIYGALGNAAIKQVAAMERSLANQYAGSFIQIKKPLDTQFGNIGTQIVQGFLRAYEQRSWEILDAFGQPVFDAIRKSAAGFSALAQRIGEWIKVVVRPFLEVFERLCREIKRWPRDPYGDPVPFWNVRLYRLAQAAYTGDYMARARFLDEIEADDSPDNVMMIGELLKPTFDPQRPDRRVDWEQMDPAEARGWLRRRLDGLKQGAWKEERERKNGELRYEMERQVIMPNPSRLPEFELIEFELREDEMRLYERLRGVLPEQQFWFCWYRAQGLKYKEIAAKMGIGLSTVKTHARLVKQNPGFLEILSP